MRDAFEGLREATELPILWVSDGPPDGAASAGADACIVRAGEGLSESHARAVELGLDCVIQVANDEELEEVLDGLDPEILPARAGGRGRAGGGRSIYWQEFRRASSRSPRSRRLAARKSSSSSGRGSMRSSSEQETSPSSSATPRRRCSAPAGNCQSISGGARNARPLPTEALAGFAAASTVGPTRAGAAAGWRSPRSSRSRRRSASSGSSTGCPFGNLLNPDEQSIVPRAWTMVHGGGGDPHWFDYPSLLLYVQRAIPGVAGRAVLPDRADRRRRPSLAAVAAALVARTARVRQGDGRSSSPPRPSRRARSTSRIRTWPSPTSR